MQAAIRSLVAALTVACLPAGVATVSLPTPMGSWGEAPARSDQLKGTSLWQTNAARLETAIDTPKRFPARIQLAQAAGEMPGSPPPGVFGLSPLDPDLFGPHAPHTLADSGMPPAMHRPFPLTASPRMACEEDIDGHAAFAGYLKSRLRLHGDQKIAWQKMEQSSEPAIDKMREVCAQLPTRMTAPPTFPEALDFLEKQLSARAELLRSLREPLRDLYKSLSPDQRAALIPPPPGPRP
jgi:hypothetical protein